MQRTEDSSTKEDIGTEAQLRAENVALVVKSFLFEGVFPDDKGVNCTSLEIVLQKNILVQFFLAVF